MAVYSMEGTQSDCYPGTTVLINKLGIKEQKMLNVAEIRIVISMTAKIESEINFENVDFDFYKTLHHRLFSDLYEWAGKIRNINISKKNVTKKIIIMPLSNNLLLYFIYYHHYIFSIAST